jgi:spore maturation protein CgeB
MPTNRFETNLKRLEKKNPELVGALREAGVPSDLEIRLSRSGLPVPILNQRSIHSSYDPAQEARKWVETLHLERDHRKQYVLGGFGFGYHVVEIFQRVDPDQLFVVEPNLPLLRAALEHCPEEFFPPELKIFAGVNALDVYQALSSEISRANKICEFIAHPSSGRIQPEFYRTLTGIIRAQSYAAMGGFKILIVSPLYGGSLPIAHYLRRAFLSLGHRSEILDNSIFYAGLRHLEALSSRKNHQAQLRGLLTALLAESITARALEIGADLVVGLAQAPFTADVLRELKTAQIATAFWFVEDGELFPYWRTFAPLFDHYFVIQKGEFLGQLRSAGCPDPQYLPLAADPVVHQPLQLTEQEIAEFGSDVSHVGAGYHNRRNAFLSLLDFNFKLWGNDWENPGSLAMVLQRRGERISTEDSVRVFNASKININLHSSTYHEAVNPFGDFLNPRTFEIASCGAFQLVDERAYLRECFIPDQEIVSFRNLQEMRDKVAYYLAHPQERREIALAARRRVLREHTYQRRALEMLGLIAGSHADWTPRAGGLPSAEEIIRQSDPDSELCRIMKRFTGKGPLTLEDLAADIEKGQGKLLRTEALILLLNEFRRWGLEKGVL